MLEMNYKARRARAEAKHGPAEVQRRLIANRKRWASKFSPEEMKLKEREWHKDQIRESSKLQRDKAVKKYGLEVIRQKERVLAKRWRDNNKMAAKNIDLKKDFGITLAQYNALLEKQQGKCLLCGGTNEKCVDRRTQKPRMLAVDHCHTTDKIRGLLCQGCNQGLGNFCDNPLVLERAALYIRGNRHERQVSEVQEAERP